MAGLVCFVYGAARPAADTAAAVSAAGVPSDSLTSAIPQIPVFDTAAAVASPVKPGPIPAGTAAPAAPADSSALLQLRDSLTTIQTALYDCFQQFPQRLDSVISPFRLLPYHLYQSDALGVSDLLKSNPYFVTVPYGLASHFNRYLAWGIPAGRPALNSQERFAAWDPDPQSGTDAGVASDVREIGYDPAGGVSLLYYPVFMVSPVTFLVWENGVFDEKLLRVLFARPLSRRISVAVFSDFEYFRGQTFSHTSGDIYDFYRGLASDTTVVMNQGRNPLTYEHCSGARLSWNTRQGRDGFVAYKYCNLRNDLQYERPDDVIAWDTLTEYIHALDLGTGAIALGPLALAATGMLRRDVRHATRVVDRTIAGLYRDRGSAITTAGEIELYRPFAGQDTVGLVWHGGLMNKTVYNRSKWRTATSRQGVSVRAGTPAGPAGLAIRAEGGYDLTAVNDSLAAAWFWNAKGTISLGRHALSVHGARDGRAYNPPFDSIDVVDGSVLDIMTGWGSDLALSFNKAALYAGYRHCAGADAATLAHAWPRGMAPYREPSSSFFITPAVGKLFGLSLYSRWIFADTRPHVKSRSELSYEVPLFDGREHIRLDLAFDYWGRRDPFEYGQAWQWPDWSREIMDLSLKTTIQIKSFRLVFKADNLLNRKIAWVPGNYMPGVTFRWGFNWYFLK